ncbi:hypothetical protein M8C21_034021 [Ambrosia artemisiifolia]|uniref:Uncharacterized protein n=1 Tax=Ambrosia artemisiifolia TaxID=4212 RepID=A0AAD5CU86_AMBAR|nr:hypothetical protein M8C21_034021 [Ambrosia artemisiifolia]
MPNIKKKDCHNNNNNINGGVEVQNKQKERHIVSWSQEEDDILRQQIGIHGTDNWAIVASKFKDKTTRQCRRSIIIIAILNIGNKAQKIFGNRWTEIAKVVSGRTDNAVKNRFSTLCKKRAKTEALAKENNTSYITTHNKRTRYHNGQELDSSLETSMPPSKIRRKHIPDTPEDYHQPRPPFSVILHNCDSLNTFTAQLNVKRDEALEDGTFLKKDDPKIIALLQQAELLSSLAHKVNTEKTDESYENACKGSPDSSEYSTGSTVLSQVIETMELSQDNIVDDKITIMPDSTTNQDILASCDEFNHDVNAICPLPNSEFNSPLQVTPLFRSMAAGIPSPQFSESVRSD